jgi:hypothetical protein
MSRQVRNLAAITMSILLLACSARLSNPIRVPTLEVHAVHKQITQTGKDAAGRPAACTESVVQFLSLPGETYELNIDTKWAWFSKNEFSVTFADAGTLKQVTLNSDPQLDETIQSTATLVKELGSVVASAAARSERSCPTKEVGTAEKVECVLPLDQWRSAGYACP